MRVFFNLTAEQITCYIILYDNAIISIIVLSFNSVLFIRAQSAHREVLMPTNQIKKTRSQSTSSTVKKQTAQSGPPFIRETFVDFYKAWGSGPSAFIVSCAELGGMLSCRGLPIACLFPCGSNEIPYSCAFYLKHC